MTYRDCHRCQSNTCASVNNNECHLTLREARAKIGKAAECSVAAGGLRIVQRPQLTAHSYDTFHQHRHGPERRRSDVVLSVSRGLSGGSREPRWGFTLTWCKVSIASVSLRAWNLKHNVHSFLLLHAFIFLATLHSERLRSRGHVTRTETWQRNRDSDMEISLCTRLLSSTRVGINTSKIGSVPLALSPKRRGKVVAY